MRKIGGLAFAVCGALFALAWMFAGLQPQIALGAPLRQNQPNGSTIAAIQTTSGTWGPGVITANASVLINPGVVITIAPNTTIRVMTNFGFTVRGNLHSDGPITFTSFTAPNLWLGITYTLTGTGYLNQAVIEYAARALLLDTPNPINITNSSLRNNRNAPASGVPALSAGVAIMQGSPVISNTDIYSNSATGNNAPAIGGGIFISGTGTPRIINSRIYGNALAGNDFLAGGGIGLGFSNGTGAIGATCTVGNYVPGGAARIEGSSITSNTLSGSGSGENNKNEGGGIGLADYLQSTAVISNNLIAANSVANSGGGIAGGGGIGLGPCATANTIDRNVIRNNSLNSSYWSEGGGIDTYGLGVVTVTNNLIYSNVTALTSQNPGGGILVHADVPRGNISVINNTIVANLANEGGGLETQSGGRIFNNIIVSNTASTTGGGLRENDVTSTGAPVANYNDVWNNRLTSGAIDNYNNIAVPPNDVSVDPMFIGSGSFTNLYHLQQGSPVLGRGTIIAMMPAYDYDLDPRPIDPLPDIGFDEIRSITLTKTVTPTIAGAGDTLTYMLVISNPDRIAPLIGGVLSDTVPPSTTYASGPNCTSGTCSYNAGNQSINWNTDLSASNQTTLTYAVTANASVPRGVPITNSFQIPLGSGIRSSNVVTTLLVPRVSFSSATYSVTESAGTAIMTVTLDARSLLPVTVNYATSNGTATAPSDYLTSTGMLTFAPGVTTATFTVTIVNNPIVEPNGTVILTLSMPNNAVLGSPNPATLIIIDAGVANLQINKSASPAVVSSGGILTYTLRYTNTGPSGALNMRITDTLPSGVMWGGVTSAVPAITLTSTTPPAWFTPALALGASGTIVFTTTVTAPGGSLLTNQAVITSTTNETITVDNIATAVTTVGLPALVISKSDNPDPVIQGDQLAYTINYTNTGTGVATNVVVAETYDANVSFLSATPAPTSGNNVWNLGALNVGQSGSIVITVQVNGGTSLINQASISSTEGAAANTSISTVVLPPGQVQIGKSVTPTLFSGVGQLVTYTIMITNTGPSDAKVQQITDTLPVGFVYSTTTAASIIRFPDAINVSGQTVTWSYNTPRPTIPTGSTATLTFVATTGAAAACNSAGVTIQGSTSIVAADNLACLGSIWPEYFITAQAGSQTIRVRVRLANGLPTILSWEFLP